MANCLEHPHRIGGTEHRNGTREPDSVGAGRCRSENDGRSRVEKFFAVVLADAERVQAHLVGINNPVEQVRQSILAGQRS